LDMTTNHIILLIKTNQIMKATLLSIFLLAISFDAISQTQAETYLQEAQTFLEQKEYRQAQMSMMDAINEINLILAQQIGESLPDEINGLKASGEDNVNTAALGIMGGGMQISKTYRNESKKENEADVQIIANSPMLTMMNMYLTNPSMMGQGAKSVKVGTTRAVLKSEMQDYYGSTGGSKQIRSTELQIPLSQTLITINLRGFASEVEELAFANKLDIAKLKIALGE